MANYVTVALLQGGMQVAGASGPREETFRGILHYAAVYGQDWPVMIKYRGRLYEPVVFYSRFVGPYRAMPRRARSTGIEVREIK